MRGGGGRERAGSTQVPVRERQPGVHERERERERAGSTQGGRGGGRERESWLNSIVCEGVTT